MLVWHNYVLERSKRRDAVEAMTCFEVSKSLTIIGTEWPLTWVYSKYLDEIADGVDKGFRTWTTRTPGLGLDLVGTVVARAGL